MSCSIAIAALVKKFDREAIANTTARTNLDSVDRQTLSSRDSARVEMLGETIAGQVKAIAWIPLCSERPS
jgi:hypothetical protein